jgi:HAD superfamily hydrolase (TIGR01509 family)
MITTLLLDFSRVLIFSKDKDYQGSLNQLYRQHREQAGYQIFSEFELNGELLQWLEQKKDTYDLYLFTTDIIQDDPAVRERIAPVFKKILSARELGISKGESSGYQHIIGSIGKSPEEVLLIDDTLVNVQTAQSVGLKTIQFVSNNQLLNDLKLFDIR